MAGWLLDEDVYMYICEDDIYTHNIRGPLKEMNCLVGTYELG